MKADTFFKKLLIGVGVAVFWIGVWWLIAVRVDQELLVPTPHVVLRTLGELIVTPSFWKAVSLSLLRVCAGFAAALVSGTVLAILTTRFRVVHALFSPLLRIVRAAPVASFIILTLVWVVTDMVPVFIAFLMVLPIVWVNVEAGIRRIDPQLREVASVYHFGRWRTLWKVDIPSVKPFFLTACVNGLGFAWKSGIAAEVICRPDLSIGRELQGAKIILETPAVFAWTAVVVILSMVLEFLLVRLASRRKEGAHADT